MMLDIINSIVCMFMEAHNLDYVVIPECHAMAAVYICGKASTLMVA